MKISKRIIAFVLLLMASIASAQTTATLSDEGFEIVAPNDARRETLSRVAPDIFESYRALLNIEKMRLIEAFMTKDDIERIRNGASQQDVTFRVLRHPLSGDARVSKATWDNTRPRYRKTLESINSDKGRSDIEKRANAVLDDKLKEIDIGGMQNTDFDRLRVYRDDDTSLRFVMKSKTAFEQDGETISISTLDFSATLFIKNRLVLVQAQVFSGDIDAQVEMYRAEFDAYVDRIVEMNP
jgi:hypothetical protein